MDSGFGGGSMGRMSDVITQPVAPEPVKKTIPSRYHRVIDKS